MKKIVRQQNYLRELIDSQGNRFISRQALQCLIRSAVEPLLDSPESGVVFHRIENKIGLQGLLKRLEFSEIESYSFSDDSNNLIEKVWANTEFICTLTHRYVSILLWDNNTGDKNFVRYYSQYNSKLQKEALDIIKRNSKVDISPYQEKYNPDRRDNLLLNSSIRRLLTNMDEATGDAVLGYAEKTAENLSSNDYIGKKSRVIAHELRNQLSICDIYTEIINRHAQNGNLEEIIQATKNISNALKMANNSLISLKTEEKSKIEKISLNETIKTAFELSKVYLDGKDINSQIETNKEVEVLADSEKLIAVIINLVKNASEAFNIKGNTQNGKYIKIEICKNGNCGVVNVSNNAVGIKEPEKIFNEGFTTKSTGNGLGLWICKKYMEEQNGSIELSRSSEDFTEFSLSLDLAK